MYRLFDKAMLWELLNVERNPMDLVEVKGISKRKKRPRVLQVKDAWQMLDALVHESSAPPLPALVLQMPIQRPEAQAPTPAKLAASHAAAHKLRH